MSYDYYTKYSQRLFIYPIYSYYVCRCVCVATKQTDPTVTTIAVCRYIVLTFKASRVLGIGHDNGDISHL